MSAEPQGHDDTDMTEAEFEAVFETGTPVRLLTRPDQPWYTVVREESGNTSASRNVVYSPGYGQVAQKSAGGATLTA